ncbi:MAG: hypothetical protein ABDH23_07350, partial [Endomicrobiia bacterium]
MRKIIMLFTFFIINYYLHSSLFSHLDWGARVVGVGLGYVGCGDVDSSVVMWNPGGLSYIGSGNELGGMYGIPFMGLG